MAALACLAELSACKKEPYIQTVEQTPYLGLPGGLNDLLCFDVSRLRMREGFQELLKDLPPGSQVTEALSVLRGRVGFDPIEQIDLLFVATRGKIDPANPFKNVVMIAKGRFPDPAPKLAALRDWLAEEYLINPPPFQRTQGNGGIAIFRTKAQSQFNEKITYELNFGFPSETLMVFSFSPSLLDETLAVVSGSQQGIRMDKTWLAMLQRPDVGAMLWGTGNISPDLLKEIPTGLAQGPVPTPPDALKTARQYYYNIDFGDQFDAQIGLVCDTIDAAEKLSAGLKSGLEQVKKGAAMIASVMPETAKLLDRIVVLTELETAKIRISLTQDQKKALTREWEKMAAAAKAGAQPPVPGTLAGAAPTTATQGNATPPPPPGPASPTPAP